MYTRSAILCCLLCFLAPGLSQAGERCDVPPANSLSLSQSYDDKYVWQWCTSQEHVSNLWNGLSLDRDKWDEGWGFERDDCCIGDNSYFLNRLLNAAWILPNVTGLRAKDGSPMDWWRFVVEREDDGYEPKCCSDDPNLYATHYCCGWDTNVCVKMGFNLDAARRAGVLVHEAAHEDVGHISDSECLGGASCDVRYGDYNANTAQIHFELEAVQAYRYALVEDAWQRQIEIFALGGTQMCHFIPYFEDAERNLLIGDVNLRLRLNFAENYAPMPYLNATDVDSTQNRPWVCQACNPDDFTFSPATFGINRACNEVLNHDNATINSANRAKCIAFNDKLTGASSAAAYAKLSTDLYGNLAACMSTNADDAHAYCLTQISSAANVEGLDPYGLLSDSYLEGSSCVQQFCLERFSSEWKMHVADPTWRDPLGCMDTLCSDDTCRRRFLWYDGNPKMYNPDYCMETFLSCQVNSEAPNDGWPAETPQISRQLAGVVACMSEYDQCVAIRDTAHRILITGLLDRPLDRPPKPRNPKATDPWRPEWYSIVDARLSPTEEFRASVAELKDLVRGGANEVVLSEQIQSLMAHRESTVALFHSEPEGFVALFGKDAYAELIGPAVTKVLADRFDQRRLNTTGEKTMDRLKMLRRDQGPRSFSSLLHRFQDMAKHGRFQELATLLQRASAARSAQERAGVINDLLSTRGQ